MAYNLYQVQMARAWVEVSWLQLRIMSCLLQHMCSQRVHPVPSSCPQGCLSCMLLRLLRKTCAQQ